MLSDLTTSRTEPTTAVTRFAASSDAPRQTPRTAAYRTSASSAYEVYVSNYNPQGHSAVVLSAGLCATCAMLGRGVTRQPQATATATPAIRPYIACGLSHLASLDVRVAARYGLSSEDPSAGRPCRYDRVCPSDARGLRPQERLQCRAPPHRCIRRKQNVKTGHRHPTLRTQSPVWDSTRGYVR